MEPSLFLDLVERYFPRLVLSITETINGQENNDQPYYFRRFLGREFSLTGRWDALSIANSRIMADVVSMDSSLPLKKRPAISSATGEIPKLGMEMALNESDLTALQTMASSNLYPESQIIERLFADTASVIRGQYERIEDMFLQGLSTGAVVVSKGTNVGTEIRLDYRFDTAKKFTSTVEWSDPTATPVSDMIPMINKASADGNPIRIVLLDRVTLNNVLRSDEAKTLYAVVNGVINGTTFPPTQAQFNEAVRSRYGFVFEVVERTTRYQINGVDVDRQPWEAGQVVGINNNALGKLVWSFLAEMNAPVAGVTYQRADDFILAAKYRVNRPSLQEFTSSQSRAVPVIGATNQIYHLDTTVNAGT